MGRIYKLRSDELGVVKEIVWQYPYLFNGQYRRDVRQDLLAKAYLCRFRDDVSAGKWIALVFSKEKNVHGLATLQKLVWDSEHFGIPMMRMDLFVDSEMKVRDVEDLIHDCLNICEEKEIKHVTVRSPISLQSPQQALASCGFRPVGVKLMLRAKAEVIDSLPNGQMVDYVQLCADYMEAVRMLSTSAITDSRFHRDGGFESTRVAAIYRSWVEQISRDNPDHIIVARKGGEVVGFLAYEKGISLYGLKAEELGGLEEGFVAFVAVSDSARGLGIGKGLIGEGMRRMWKAGCNVFYANVILSNESSVNAFLGTGFTLMGSLQEFHIWR